MAAYPTDPVWSFPVTRRLEFQTRIVRGESGTEQRWPLTVGRESITLEYPRITLAERDVLLAIFEAARGAADQTLTLALEGETLQDLYFDADKFSAEEFDQGQWRVRVVLGQVARAADLSAIPADFPVLSTGNRMQLPYTHEREYDTEVVETEGWRYTYSRRATPVQSWSVGGRSLSTTDARAIWNMFSAARGQWGVFGFTDPDTDVRHAACRFATDTLEWRMLGPDENVIEARIQQVI